MTRRLLAENTCLSIVGPTASGKTDVAILIAEALHGEILSADSVAVYRGLDIGSAKPSTEERSRIPFHGVDVAEPEEVFTAARFRELSQNVLDGIWQRGKSAICCGGTGFYVRAALDGFGLTSTPADPEVRARLEREAEERGAPSLHIRLSEVDPIAAARIHPNDQVRIVRALEVWETTGETISSHQTRDAENRTVVPGTRIGLHCRMELLDERINRRTDVMLDSGWLDEVTRLLEVGHPPDCNGLKCLGYAEMVQVAQGNMSVDEARETIARNTRKYARRQRTWFRADRRTEWLDIEGRTPDSLADEILTRLRRAGELK